MIFSIDEAPASLPVMSIGQSELEARADFLKSHSGLIDRLLVAHEANQKAFEPAQHVEAQIYEGFPNESDHKLMDEFHAADLSRRASIVSRLADPRLKTIGNRLLHIERPHLMDPQTRRAHDQDAAKRSAGRSEFPCGLTLREAIDQIDKFLGDPKHPHIELLAEHREFLQSRLSAVELHLPSS